MSHFTLIVRDLNVAPLLAELDANPSAWNHRPERRAGLSPHRETSDIWARYASENAMRQPDFHLKPHDSVWWPAIRQLPSVVDLTMQVWGKLGGNLRLGGILLTRIPGGKQVYEHSDAGPWHAEFYSTKVWIVLRGNDQCVNTVEDEEIVWQPGEGWSHNNLIRHSVRNEGDSERICLIICYRRLDG